MDGLKMMTVLGSFQGNGSGGGADLSGGGDIGGDLRVNGDLSACGNIAANTMHANELTAGTGAFESLSVGGQSIGDIIGSIVASNSGCGGNGTDFTHGGTMQGSLTVQGGLTVQSGLGVVGTIGAAAANFSELYINGAAVDFGNIASGSGSGGITTSAPREPQPIGDAEYIQDGYRYIITNADACVEGNGYYFSTPVCAYAQAEIWIDNTNGALTITYPSDWLWPNDCTCNPRLYESACSGNGQVPYSVCGNMQVIKIRHDGRAVLANLEYQYPVGAVASCSC